MEHYLYELLAIARNIAADLDGGRQGEYDNIATLIEEARSRAAKRATDMEAEDPEEGWDEVYF